MYVYTSTKEKKTTSEKKRWFGKKFTTLWSLVYKNLPLLASTTLPCRMRLVIMLHKCQEMFTFLPFWSVSCDMAKGGLLKRLKKKTPTTTRPRESENKKHLFLLHDFYDGLSAREWKIPLEVSLSNNLSISTFIFFSSCYRERPEAAKKKSLVYS